MLVDITLQWNDMFVFAILATSLALSYNLVHPCSLASAYFRIIVSLPVLDCYY